MPRTSTTTKHLIQQRTDDAVKLLLVGHSTPRKLPWRKQLKRMVQQIANKGAIRTRKCYQSISINPILPDSKTRRSKVFW